MSFFSTSLGVLRYICTTNRLSRIPAIIFRSFAWQIAKRLSGCIVPVTLFNKKNILVFPDNEVSSFFIYSDFPDKEEIGLLRNGSIPGETVFLDIGSNIGSYSLMMADICEVVAFEPHPDTAVKLKMNFLLNGIDTKNVYESAVGKDDGTVCFTNMDSSAVNRMVDMGSRDAYMTVDLKKLDSVIHELSYGKEKRYVVKIDVEGAEHDVLLGGEKFFTEYDVSIIVFECFGDQNLKNISLLLNKYGFTVKRISTNNFFAKK